MVIKHWKLIGWQTVYESQGVEHVETYLSGPYHAESLSPHEIRLELF